LPPPPLPPLAPYDCPVATMRCMGRCIHPIQSAECPISISADTPGCDQPSLVESGDVCEADGECGLSDDLNNCAGGWDVYRTVDPGQLWIVIAGAQHCEVTNHGKCVTDGLGQDHGNNEDCIIQAATALFATATHFETETGYDYIAVGASRYDGVSGPVSLPMISGERMTWHTDADISNAGFTICASISAPAVSLSGLCTSQAACNGWYEVMGTTASGANWYKHLLHSDRCTLYFDPSCNKADVNDHDSARWIVDVLSSPNKTALSDLDDDLSCHYAAHINYATISHVNDSNVVLPLGTHTWRVYCGEWTDIPVTVEALPPPSPPLPSPPRPSPPPSPPSSPPPPSTPPPSPPLPSPPLLSPPPPSPIEDCDDEPTSQSGGVDSCPTGGGCGEKTTLSLNLISGWNWVSLNVAPDDYSVQHVLNKTAMKLTDEDALKDTRTFTLFYDVTGFNQWYGELRCMTNTEMFKLKLQGKEAQTARVRGKPVKLPMKLTVVTGWNWLPYPYQEASSLLDAGGNFDHSVLTSGDVFKRNNAQFTRWYDVTGYKGWIGSPNAQHLEPGEGHKLLLASGGNFTFPAPESRRQLAHPLSSTTDASMQEQARWITACSGSGGLDASTWSVSEGAFQTSNLMTVGVKIDGKIMSSGWLAAFFGDEIRGVQKDQSSVPSLDIAGEWAGTKVFSLAVQGNIDDSGKMITLRYSADGKSSVKLTTATTWSADEIVGSAFSPYVVMTKCTESVPTQVV